MVSASIFKIQAYVYFNVNHISFIIVRTNVYIDVELFLPESYWTFHNTLWLKTIEFS